MFEVIDGLVCVLDGGVWVYWVCLLVEESEVVDLIVVEEWFKVLCVWFGVWVCMVYG